MDNNYREIMKHVRFHEGGYSNHPSDPGGATMFGVIQSVYDSYRHNRGLFTRSVRLIEEREVEEIYRTRYWNKICGDRLPSGVDYAVMDAGVNSGVGRGAKWLQEGINALIPQGKIKVDSDIGETTIRMAKACDPVALVNQICDRRYGFVKSLRIFATFGDGWTNRIEGFKDKSGVRRGGVRQWAIEMARKTSIEEPAKPVPPPLAPDTRGKDASSPVAILIAILGAAAFALWRYFFG